MGASDGSENRPAFPIKLNVKYGNEVKKELLLQESVRTVPELKELIGKELDIPAPEQRLIFAGKLLKDADEVSKYNLYDGCTLHLVRHGAAKARPPSEDAASSTVTSGPGSGLPTQQPSAGGAQMPFAGAFPAPTGMPGMYNNPEFARELMQNPELMRGISQMFSNNPALMQTMIQNDPHLQSLPPETRNLLTNPDVLRMLLNPELMSSLESTLGHHFPQGMNAVPQQSQPFNPWSMIANANYAQPQQQPQSQQASQSQVPPETRFQTQLDQLEQMGFPNKNLNIQALTITNGNVDAAVDWLLRGPG